MARRDRSGWIVGGAGLVSAAIVLVYAFPHVMDRVHDAIAASTRSRGELTGRLVWDHDGSPVAGAVVAIDPFVWHVGRGPDGIRSDADGVFRARRVEEGRHSVYVFHDGYEHARFQRSVWVPPNGTQDLGEIRLVPRGSLEVIVIGDDGEPYDGARVRLESGPIGQSGHGSWTTCGVGGRVSFDRLGLADYHVVVERRDAHGWYERTHALDRRSMPDGSIRLRPDPPSSERVVRVVSIDGEPFPMTTIRVEWRDGAFERSKATDRDGRATLRIPSDRVRVRLWNVGERSVEYDVDVARADGEIELVVPDGAITARIGDGLHGGWAVALRVVELDGDPDAAIRPVRPRFVSMRLEAGLRRGDHARFSELPAGRYGLEWTRHRDYPDILLPEDFDQLRSNGGVVSSSTTIELARGQHVDDLVLDESP